MATKKELSALFGMEPKEATAYLEQKKLKTSWDYTEIFGEAHSRTFTVAKIMKLDLLKDVHDSLQQAAKEGTPFKEWKAGLKPTLAAKGWYGKTEVFNPDTGEFKTITVGARRLKTIYETNMRSAYNYGRYQHLSKSGMAYWMYVSALLPTTRDTHRAMHGAVYAKDHPFWSANYPPNGYNCKCKVRGYTKKMLEQRGITPREHYETIADVGFAHRPGSGALEGVWQEKILNAPKEIRTLAGDEKALSDRYDEAFAHDTSLVPIMQRFKKQLHIDPHADIHGVGAYSVKTKKMIFKRVPDTPLLRHESGHALDHAYDFLSAKMLASLNKDVASWKNRRDEIKEMLTSKTYDDDFYLHDLFYLSSEGWVGYKTREPWYITDDKKHKEAFANLFEAYLSGGEKLGIIKTYFPNSYRKFLKLLATIKES